MKRKRGWVPCRGRKLTTAQVTEIFHDTRSNEELAKVYGVSYTMIWYIKKGRKWKGLNLPEQEPTPEGSPAKKVDS